MDDVFNKRFHAIYKQYHELIRRKNKISGLGNGVFERYTYPVITSEHTPYYWKYDINPKTNPNMMGPAPIKTKDGWLTIAHGVRNCAAGMRYVLYVFLTDLNEPWKVTHLPGGYFIAPEGEERIGDVSNVLFCNGVVAKENGDVYIYYASSDNTPPDAGRSFACVGQRNELIKKNLEYANMNNLNL